MENKNIKSLNKKKLFLIVGILTLMVALIGSSYAFFTYSREGSDPLVIRMGGFAEADFSKGTNKITYGSAYPISDAYAIAHLDKLTYLDFTVVGNAHNNEKSIYYELYLTEESGNTLSKDYIKVYLTDEKNQKVAGPFTYSSLLSATPTDPANGKKLFTDNVKGAFSKKYRIYAWIDESYSQNTTSQKFDFKMNFYASDEAPSSLNTNFYASNALSLKTLIETLKEKAYTDASELIAIDVTDKSDIKKCASIEACADKKVEYRYSGPTANNYIKLTDNNGTEEDWRIIGIFTDESGEEYLRVVRDSVLPEDYLPNTYTINNASIKGSTLNRWEESGLQYYLNTESDDNSQKGYLSYLSSDVKALLQEKKLYLGTLTSDSNGYISDTPKQAYKYERATECSGNKGTISNSSKFTDSEKCRVWEGNMATYDKSKVSLMYPSDYGLSATEDNWTTNLGGASNETWMFSTMSDSSSKHSWFVSPSSQSSNSATNWNSDGNVHTDNTSNFDGVRPVLNLSPRTVVIDGDGTSSTSAYKIFG